MDMRTLAACAGNNFSHNVQSVRVVERLENRGEGLNLTWEVRDGMLNHKTSCTPHTLEGQCVRLADKIAYVNHDIDDAIRGNILKEEDLPTNITDILGFRYLYTNPIAKSEELKADKMLRILYEYFIEDASRLTNECVEMIYMGEDPQTVVCDYIAGMTDNYAIETFKSIYIPKSWKV